MIHLAKLRITGDAESTGIDTFETQVSTRAPTRAAATQIITTVLLF